MRSLSIVLLATFTAAAPAPPALATAARKFLASLDDAQRKKAHMAFADPRRTQWNYSTGATRKGLSLGAMTPAQRKLAMAMLEASLSERGFAQAKTIMGLEVHLRQDPGAYFYAVYGDPGEKGTWSWGVQGHHLSLNYVVQDGVLKSVTPAFFGANPAVAPGGTRALTDEEVLGFRLLASLEKQQRERTVMSDRTPGDMREAGRAQADAGVAVGLPGAQMTAEQKAILRKLVETYVQRMPKAFAAEYLKRVDFDKLRFAWYGATEAGRPFSYHLQGAVLLIRFYHARRNHCHSVWRTIGADFGR